MGSNSIEGNSPMSALDALNKLTKEMENMTGTNNSQQKSTNPNNNANINNSASIPNSDQGNLMANMMNQMNSNINQPSAQ